MKIQVSRVMKVKSSYSSQRETETSSFGACSVAMDDGGRCLLDVIGDPKLLQSFLESGSDENSKDPQDGTSSESAVESPQVPRTSHAGPTTNHLSSNESLIDTSDHMGYGNTYTLDGGGQGLLAQQGMSLVVPQTYQHASSSGATIHHMPTIHPPHSPARSLTPNVKSPGHSMPPPSPLTSSHTPSPAPAWSPAPPVLSPAASSSRAFQQQQQQIIQTSCSVTQFVTALTAASQPVQQQQKQPQQVFLQQQPAPARMSSGQPQMVQLIHHSLPPTRHGSVRPIQPKLPPQILPKPATTASQFAAPAPAPKQQAPSTQAVNSNQRTAVGVGIQQQPPAPHGQLVMGQPGMFSSPGGTILLNQIIPGMGQNHPILIQGGLQGLLLRNQGGVAPGQATSAQNNATLIAALQGHGQHAHQTLFTPAKSATLGQQTIVIPNNLGGAATAGMGPAQNINLGPAGSGLISTSQPGQAANLFARTSNIILSPRNQGGLQLQQLQAGPGSIITFANGQAFAVPHLQAAPTIMGQLSLQSQPPSALQPQPQPLFGTVPLEPVIQMQPQLQLQQQQQPAQQQQLQESPPKPPKAPGVNLEELLKEHGIVPEESPPSPDCSHSPLVTCSTTEEQQQQQTMVPSQQQLLTALQSQQVLLEQPQGTHIKVQFTQDGSMIFPLGTTNQGRSVQHFLSSNQLLGRTANNCVLLPTATTSVSVPAVTMDTTSAAASRNHSTLIARLNAAPAISVPDVVCISTSAASTTASLSSGGYVVQRAGGGGSLLLAAEDPSTSSSPSSSSSMQTVQNCNNSKAAANANNAAFQALLVQSSAAEQRTVSSSSSHQPAKAQQSMPVLLSHPPPKGDVQPDSVADNNGVVQNHNHATYQANVPNSTNSVLLQKVQKKIDEMMSIKQRSPEQQKLLQQLLSAQQKLLLAAQNKFGRGGRGNQYQYQAKMEIDVERLLQKCRTSPCVVSEPQQIQTKVPVLTVQQSGQIEKQQSAKSANSHGVHLVNLLKQNSQHNVPAKLVASPSTTVTTTMCDSTTTVSSSVTTVQKINQVINSTPRLQNAHQQCSKTPEITVPQQVIVRVQKPIQQQQPQQQQQQQPQQLQQQPSTVPSAPTLVQIKAPPPPPPVKKVVNTVPKTVLFNDRLSRDQNAAVKPDVKTPFRSITDACYRLLPYHVYNSKDPSEIEIHKADIAFSEVSNKLMSSYSNLMNRFQLTLLKESMITAPSSELVMLNQLFVEDEQEALKNDKSSVAEGKPLQLPPPPKYWLEAEAKAEEAARPPPTPSPPVVVKVEADFFPDEQDSYSRGDFSDPTTYDHLEAPVIDSCEDPPPPDTNIERSPPTLKRIVLKPPADPKPPRKKPRTDPYLDFDMSPMEMGGPVGNNSNHLPDFDPRTTEDFDLLASCSDWTTAGQPGGLDLSGLDGLGANGSVEDLQVQSAVKSITGTGPVENNHYYDGSGYHHLGSQSGFDDPDLRTSVTRESDLEAAVRSILMR